MSDSRSHTISRVCDELECKIDRVAVRLEGLHHVLDRGERIADTLTVGAAVGARLARELAGGASVESGRASLDMEPRMSALNWPRLSLLLRRNHIFILPQSYSMPEPASSQWPFGDMMSR